MRVAAVVVTYNRKELLIRCLNAILHQTRGVDKIFLIDNASTDGTQGFLRKSGLVDDGIIEYIRLEENMGGAGGFAIGLDLAFKAGYDYFWLMDDDGVPNSECLSSLLGYVQEFHFLGPVVLCDERRLSFPFSWPGVKGLIEDLNQLQRVAKNGVLVGEVCVFNGVLISRLVVQKIGVPKREFFIWGDEVEYRARAIKAGFQVATVCSAKHYHPSSRVRNLRLPLKLGWVWIPDDRIRLYLVVRNYSYIKSRYWDRHSLKFFIKYLLYLSFATCDKKIILLGMLDGLFGNFNRLKRLAHKTH